MSYQIVEIGPVYHAFTDAQIGTKVVSRSHAYETEALAHKIAGIRAHEHYENCGDNYFKVVEYGKSPFDYRDVVSNFDDMPF